jgi:hypothetical protein
VRRWQLIRERDGVKAEDGRGRGSGVEAYWAGWVGNAGFQLINYMLSEHLLHQWGIWFIAQGESYEGNVHLITELEGIADFAYFWLHSPIASLSKFFLKEDQKQRTYPSRHPATRSTAK